MTATKVTRRGMIGGGAGLAAIAAAHDSIRTAPAQPAQKTFVLVHGTFGRWLVLATGV
jgi:hypothetical protein